MEGDKVWTHYMKVFRNFQLLSYQINLAQLDDLWVAKSVQIDKIQTFWDEFEVQFGENREELIREELFMAREVRAHHFVIGAEPMAFVLFGSAGSGKSAMLFYLNWLVNCNSRAVLQEHFDDPSTLYFNVENKPKYPFPKPIVSIYVDSRHLFKLMSETTGDFHEYAVFSSVLQEAAISTYFQLFHKNETEETPQPNATEAENGLSHSRSRNQARNNLDKMRRDLRASMAQFMNQTRIVLLLDNLQDIPASYRSDLIASLCTVQAKFMNNPVESERCFLYRILIVTMSSSLLGQQIDSRVNYMMLSQSYMQHKHEGHFDVFSEKDKKIQFLERLMPHNYQSILTSEMDSEVESDLDLSSDQYSDEVTKSKNLESLLTVKFEKNRPKIEYAVSFLNAPVDLFLYSRLLKKDIIPHSLYDLVSGIYSMFVDFKSNFGNQYWSAEVHESLLEFVGFMYLCCGPYCGVRNHIVENFSEVLNIVISSLLIDGVGIFGEILHRIQSSDTLSAAKIVELLKASMTSFLICNQNFNFSSFNVLSCMAARFVMNAEISAPIISALASNKMIGSFIFTWNRCTKIADRNWSRFFDLIGSRMGTSWIASNIVGDCTSYLAALYNKGVDPTDIGCIKFSNLLRIFSIEQSELLLQSKSLMPQAKLSASFGSAFQSILSKNPLAILHLDVFPNYQLSAFHSEEKKNFIVSFIMDILKKNGSMLITDILLKFCNYNLLTERYLKQLQTIIVEEKPSSSKMQAIKILTYYILKNPDQKHNIRYIISALGDTELTVSRMAMECLKVISEANLEEFITSKEKDPDSGLPMGHNILYPRETWNLIFTSAYALLTNLISKNFHDTVKNKQFEKNLVNVGKDKFVPTCRYHQCKHLPSILGLMEVPLPGMHLLANILLSNALSTMNNTKKVEGPKLEAVLGMLRIQNTVWKSTNPQAEIINEFTKGNRSLQLIANIICETLGPQASQTVVLYEDLIKTKVDFLVHCSVWVWSILSVEARKKIFCKFMDVTDTSKADFPNITFRCHFVHLNSLDFVFHEGNLIDRDSVTYILNNLLKDNIHTLILQQILFFLNRLTKLAPVYQLDAMAVCNSYCEKWDFSMDAKGNTAYLIEAIVSCLCDMLAASTQERKAFLIRAMLKMKIKSILQIGRAHV